MKQLFLQVITFLFFIFPALSQSVGIGTNSPSSNAILELSSTTGALLPPRLTTLQRDAIQNPDAGLTLYNSSINRLQYWNGARWLSLDSSVNADANSSYCDIAVVYGSGTSASPDGYAYGLSTSGNWVSQLFPTFLEDTGILFLIPKWLCTEMALPPTPMVMLLLLLLMECGYNKICHIFLVGIGALLLANK